MGNPFIHVELHTHDLARSKKFYKDLFDWQLEDVPGMEYTVIKVGDGTGGGMMTMDLPGVPDNWFPYILVDDVAAYTQQAKSLGATVAKDVTAVPDMGWLSVIVDPTGAAFGLWQPKPGM